MGKAPEGRRVQHPQARDGADEGLRLGRIEQLARVVEGVLVIEQVAQPVAPEGVVAVRGPGLPGQRGRQRLAHHVIHDMARRVVGAGGLARGRAGLRIVGGEQVLEGAAEQFRIERHLAVERRVLLHREFVAAEEREEAVLGVEEQAGRHVQALA